MDYSSIRFELGILRANDINLKSPKKLFIRCYLSAGNNRRVKLETKEIPSNSNLTWNQTFSLDCSGTQESIERLKRGTITLELRCRRSKKAPFLNTIGGSKLLGRAEIPWKSSSLDESRWVAMSCEHDYDDATMGTTAVFVAMNVREVVIERQRFDEERNECGCVDCDERRHYCIDNYDFYAIGAAVEAL